tara:strand:+ start:464 stop:598 length:135 start_codon:yes stop_codon:yes gene_type:complete
MEDDKNINIGMKNKLNELFKKFSLVIAIFLGSILLIYILLAIFI